MKILLQRKDTGEYFQDTGLWARNAGDAMDFLSSTKAIEYCMSKKLSGVHLVLKFAEQHYDIVMPVAGRYSGPRLARA